MQNLNELENRSIFIMREAVKKYKKPALLWSMGKDSTTMLHLARKAFFGKIPFPVVHIDTSFKFPGVYEFREKYAKEFGINLVIAQNKSALQNGIKCGKECDSSGVLICCNELKTNALKQAIKENDFDAVFVGIRRDEHGVRAKERYFSPRDKNFAWNVSKEKIGGDSGLEASQDSEMSGWNIYATEFREADHVRIHPLLHWTELEIWNYIKQENIPVPNLYFSKNGKRYRSIGCKPACFPIESNADTIEKIISELGTTSTKEREGRLQDKEREYTMEKLRSLGYM